MSLKKIIILFSGKGTNASNIVKKLHKKNKVEVIKAITNVPKAKGIKILRKEGIKVDIIDNKKYKNREEFDKKLVAIIKKENVDLVVLAGFMRILSPIFTKNIFAINLHPSILPLFKGNNAIKRSFHSGMKLAGVTVHKVNEELDSGEIIAQKVFNISKNESLKSFEKKIHKLEYKILPKAIINILKRIDNVS